MRHSSQQEIATPTTQEVSNRNKYFTTKRIVYLATMTAITLLLKIYGSALSISISDSMRISFVYSAWIIAGATLGAIGGGIAGAISDIICSLALGWTINPLITLSNFIFPCIIGLAFKFIPTKGYIIKMCIGTALATLVSTMFVTTLGLYTMYGIEINFFAYMLSTRMFQLIVIAINLGICLVLYPPIKKLKMFNLK